MPDAFDEPSSRVLLAGMTVTGRLSAAKVTVNNANVCQRSLIKKNIFS